MQAGKGCWVTPGLLFTGRWLDWVLASGTAVQAPWGPDPQTPEGVEPEPGWEGPPPTDSAPGAVSAGHFQRRLSTQVSAYGFITEGHERFSDHYYDKTWKKLVFYINHDFQLEREVWKRLHTEGIIRLFQRPDKVKAKS